MTSVLGIRAAAGLATAQRRLGDLTRTSDAVLEPRVTALLAAIERDPLAGLRSSSDPAAAIASVLSDGSARVNESLRTDGRRHPPVDVRVSDWAVRSLPARPWPLPAGVVDDRSPHRVGGRAAHPISPRDEHAAELVTHLVAVGRDAPVRIPARSAPAAGSRPTGPERVDRPDVVQRPVLREPSAPARVAPLPDGRFDTVPTDRRSSPTRRPLAVATPRGTIRSDDAPDRTGHADLIRPVDGRDRLDRPDRLDGQDGQDGQDGLAGLAQRWSASIEGERSERPAGIERSVVIERAERAEPAGGRWAISGPISGPNRSRSTVDREGELDTELRLQRAFRGLLEDLLLDEALGDGLEVTT